MFPKPSSDQALKTSRPIADMLSFGDKISFQDERKKTVELVAQSKLMKTIQLLSVHGKKP